MRTIKIAALNITMHQPHSSARYVDLFRQAYRLKHMVRLGKLHGAIIGSLYSDQEKGRDGVPKELSGEIYRFVNLDQSQPWFNTATGEAATEEEVQEIAIPEHLLPHLQRLPFVFRPQRHELVYVSQDRGDRMGPQTAVTFLQRLFDHVLTIRDFPPVDVTAFVDKEALEDLLSIPKLERLTIELKRPNADDLGSETERWMKKLEKQKAKSARTELLAAPGESLLPDAETRTVARVAADNGKVSVVGRDANGVRIEESTVERPLVITEHVDDNVETVAQVLQRTKIG